MLLLVVVLAAMYFGLHALDRRDTGNTDDEEDDYAYVSGDNEIISTERFTSWIIM